MRWYNWYNPRAGTIGTMPATIAVRRARAATGQAGRRARPGQPVRRGCPVRRCGYPGLQKPGRQEHAVVRRRPICRRRIPGQARPFWPEATPETSRCFSRPYHPTKAGRPQAGGAVNRRPPRPLPAKTISLRDKDRRKFVGSQPAGCVVIRLPMSIICPATRARPQGQRRIQRSGFPSKRSPRERPRPPGIKYGDHRSFSDFGRLFRYRCLDCRI